MSVFYLVNKKQSYLPFLGETVIPLSVPEYKPINSKILTIIDVEDSEAVKVMYWGANPSATVFNNHDLAYQNFTNAGIVSIVDKKATLYFNGCPAKYKVPKYGFSEQLLPSHVHYRYIRASGMASEVFTKELNC